MGKRRKSRKPKRVAMPKSNAWKTLGKLDFQDRDVVDWTTQFIVGLNNDQRQVLMHGSGELWGNRWIEHAETIGVERARCIFLMELQRRQFVADVPKAVLKQHGFEKKGVCHLVCLF